MIEDSQHERLRLLRALFPELAARVDSAHEAAAGAGANAGARLDARLDELAAHLLPGSHSLAIGDAGVSEAFDRALAAAQAAAGLLGVEPPGAEAFAEAGVDFAALGRAVADDPSLTPVPAPHGLGPDAWRQAFAGGDRRRSPELLLAAEALGEFGLLDAVPQPAPPIVRTSRTDSGGVRREARWTLRLVPAGERPPLLGLAFAHGPHVTLPEMLMLQLMRLEAGEAPVDSASFTWLAGALAGGRLAARHVYDAAEHAIRITSREVVSQGPHLGARPPVG